MGRTSKFTPEFKKKALILFRKGYSDREAFTELGISKNTFYRYLNENSDFSDQIQQVREKNVPHVENCMLKKCEGYFIEEEEILGRYEETKEPILDKDGKPTGEFKIIKGMKPYTVKKTKKYIPPSD
ncbi:MAG TPA: hypothetical protein PKJ95_03920, partial [Atribacterota bacterium]|nr:hypothetical protein [Atribacterota bacterium]